MACTFLIRNTNDVSVTQKEAIMQRDKLTNRLYVICRKLYNDFDMIDFDLIMTYKLPISKKVNFVTLTMTEDSYKDEFYRYTLDVDTNLTSENGDVEIQLMFVKTEMELEGEAVQYVRNIKPLSLHICQLSDWLVAPDDALNTLSQLYLANKNSIEALNKLAQTFNETKLDDIALDVENSKLVGKANGQTVGEGVELKDLNPELVEAGEQTTGNIKIHII